MYFHLQLVIKTVLIEVDDWLYVQTVITLLFSAVALCRYRQYQYLASGLDSRTRRSVPLALPLCLSLSLRDRCVIVPRGAG